MRVSRRGSLSRLAGALGLMGLALGLVACEGPGIFEPPPPPDTVQAATTEYQLGAGDELRVTVFREEDLSGEYAVDGAGIISFPLIGSVQAAGMTIRQLEATLVQEYGAKYLRNPKVSIQVLNYRPFYILGEVNKPGSYPYVNGMTVLNAVAIAGGFSYRARTARISIIRASDPTKTERLAKETSIVLPGDIIKVPERYF